MAGTSANEPGHTNLANLNLNQKPAVRSASGAGGVVRWFAFDRVLVVVTGGLEVIEWDDTKALAWNTLLPLIYRQKPGIVNFSSS